MINVFTARVSERKDSAVSLLAPAAHLGRARRLDVEHPDVLVAGGGLGGIAATLALAERGRTVVMTEPTRWIGGQLTSQLVPLDEHRHIERTGANRSYRRFREGVRRYHRDWFPLTDRAREDPELNPGASWVTRLSHDPRVGLAVLESMLAPHVVSGRVRILLEHEPVAAETDGDQVSAVRVRDLVTGTERTIEAAIVLDATEFGDLLPLGGVEHVSGRESRDQTGEPNAAETPDPTDMQSATWCFAIEHLAGEDHTIERPELYDELAGWRPPAWAGRPILGFAGPNEVNGHHRVYRFEPNAGDDPFEIDTDHRNMGDTPELWTYRRILARDHLTPGTAASDVTIVNWPMNDYVGGALFGVPDAAEHRHRARQLSLSLLYWLQTEAPRPDGGTGWPGLRLRADVAGTADGLAMAPYVRESRRITAKQTVREQDISVALRGDRGAESFADSVGVGHYYWMDRHGTTGGRPGDSGVPHPFQIPLGALVPERVTNLIPACKNIGTTQITNGAYRLHPVEWAIGEAAGALADLCLATGADTQAVHASPDLVEHLQESLRRGGAQLEWEPGIQP